LLIHGIAKWTRRLWRGLSDISAKVVQGNHRRLQISEAVMREHMIRDIAYLAQRELEQVSCKGGQRVRLRPIQETHIAVEHTHTLIQNERLRS
jgi:hypothetical protein